MKKETKFIQGKKIHHQDLGLYISFRFVFVFLIDQAATGGGGIISPQCGQ